MSLLLVLSPPFKKISSLHVHKVIGEAIAALMQIASNFFQKTQQQGELSLSFDCGHYLLLPAKITTR